MNEKQAFKKLHISLSEAIQKWMDDNCESDEWESINTWVGDNISSHMADAAISVLGGLIDCHEYLRKEGQLKY